MTKPKKPTKRSTLLLGPIDIAIEKATTAGGMTDEDAHEARKSLKKGRAALRLLRPALGDTVYRRENAALRDASRSISTLRDARVLMDVLAALRERYAKHWPASDLSPIERRMHADLGRIRHRMHGSAGTTSRAVALLKRSRHRLARLLDSNLQSVEITAGLARLYNRARKQFAHATTHETGEELHEWRKRTKYFSNAIRLIGANASAHQRSLAKRAERLADWLGDEHDLAAFALRAKRETSGLAGPAASRLQRLIERRRRTLQRRALHLGSDLFAKKARKALGR